MSLYKRTNMYWAYVWIDGVRECKSTGTSNRRLAEGIERQFREELNLKRHRLPHLKPEMTFGELSARFLAEGMAKPYSVDRLKHLLPFFSKLRLHDIGKATVRRYRQERHREKEITVATVNRDLEALRRILYWGVEEGFLLSNPLGRMRMERERRTKRPVLSFREERLLLAAASPHLKKIILCALDTGMRKGEILGQRWEDVDSDNCLLNVSHSKTPEGEMREIPLTRRLATSLLREQKTTGYVFTFEGAPLKLIKTTWKSTLRRSGIRHFRFHDLRHTANTRLMLAGVLQEVRREIIGHTSRHSRDMNDRYTQIGLPEKRDAIHKLQLWLDAQANQLGAGEQNSNDAPSPEPEPQPAAQP